MEAERVLSIFVCQSDFCRLFYKRIRGEQKWQNYILLLPAVRTTEWRRSPMDVFQSKAPT